MNEKLKMGVLGFMILLLGGVCGYLLNEVTVLEDYVVSCNDQCQAYVEYLGCNWRTDEPVFVMNISVIGDNYD